MKHLLCLLALLLPTILSAGEVVYADVEYKDERYFVEIETVVNAGSDKIYSLLTDYDHLTRLNDNIKESYLVYSLDDETHRTHIVTDTCITFFCTSFTLQQDVEELGNGIIVTTVVPRNSDFIYGHARWQIEDNGANTTRIIYSNDMKPAFYVPPLIGPLVIKSKIRQEVLTTIDGLEKLAKNDQE